VCVCVCVCVCQQQQQHVVTVVYLCVLVMTVSCAKMGNPIECHLGYALLGNWGPTEPCTAVTCYYAPCRRGALSVRPSVGPTWQHLGAQCHGQATGAVRTADPSAHGRRSAAIGGGILSRHAITCCYCYFHASHGSCKVLKWEKNLGLCNSWSWLLVPNKSWFWSVWSWVINLACTLVAVHLYVQINWALR